MRAIAVEAEVERFGIDGSGLDGAVCTSGTSIVPNLLPTGKTA